MMISVTISLMCESYSKKKPINSYHERVLIIIPFNFSANAVELPLGDITNIVASIHNKLLWSSAARLSFSLMSHV